QHGSAPYLLRLVHQEISNQGRMARDEGLAFRLERMSDGSDRRRPGVDRSPNDTGRELTECNKRQRCRSPTNPSLREKNYCGVPESNTCVLHHVLLGSAKMPFNRASSDQSAMHSNWRQADSLHQPASSSNRSGSLRRSKSYYGTCS